MLQRISSKLDLREAATYNRRQQRLVVVDRMARLADRVSNHSQ